MSGGECGRKGGDVAVSRRGVARELFLVLSLFPSSIRAHDLSRARGYRLPHHPFKG